MVFTKLGMCIDIVEIWFGIANGQISSHFYGVICPRYAHIGFPDYNLSKLQGIFTKLAICIDIKQIWFGIAIGQISSKFYGVICLRHTHIFVPGRKTLVIIVERCGAVVKRRTRDREVWGSIPTSSKCCFLEQETLSTLLSTGFYPGKKRAKWKISTRLLNVIPAFMKSFQQMQDSCQID